MELHPGAASALYAITSYDEQGIVINHIRYTHNLIILPDTPPALWPVSSLDELDIHDFRDILATQPDLLIVGTGNSYRFLPQKLLFRLVSEKIGVESMTTLAACRTFNLLLSEGRRIALALFMENPI